MINKVFLTGHLGKNPEVRSVGESKVATFSLATTEKVNKNNEWVSETTWHNIVIWGKQADFVEKYIKKGALVNIIGSVKYRQYEKDGVTKYITEIKAEELTSLYSKKEDSLPTP